MLISCGYEKIRTWSLRWGFRDGTPHHCLVDRGQGKKKKRRKVLCTALCCRWWNGKDCPSRFGGVLSKSDWIDGCAVMAIYIYICSTLDLQEIPRFFEKFSYVSHLSLPLSINWFWNKYQYSFPQFPLAMGSIMKHISSKFDILFIGATYYLKSLSHPLKAAGAIFLNSAMISCAQNSLIVSGGLL